MPAPTTWLIAYDVCEPRRLARLHRFLAKRAQAVQYSVFTAELSPKERSRLEREIRQRIDPKVDDVRFYPLPEGTAVEQLAAGMLGEGVFRLGGLAQRLVTGEPPGARDTPPPRKR